MTVEIHGRPDFADHDFGITYAKKFPEYVYSANGMGCLIHKIVAVRIRWWEPHYDKLVRKEKPTIMAETVCGMTKFLTGKWRGGNAKTCAVPRPDAVLCGRCHGEPASFGPHGKARKAGLTRRQAKMKLGCIAESVEVERAEG